MVNNIVAEVVVEKSAAEDPSPMFCYHQNSLGYSCGINLVPTSLLKSLSHDTWISLGNWFTSLHDARTRKYL
jgi:hypothetical protein